MKKHLKFFILRVPLNYLANQLNKTMIWGTPNPQLFRNLFSSCLNSKIIDSLIKIPGSFFGKFWQMVVNWNLGSFFMAFSRIIYHIMIQPVIRIIEKQVKIILDRLEQRFIAVQDEFYLKMEDFFTHEEPGDYIAIVQNIDGQQFTFQYNEIAYFEGSFALFREISYFLLNFQGRFLENFEKTWIWLDKFQNRRSQSQVFAMPDFEITNPEIFQDRSSEPSTSEFGKRDFNLQNINKQKISNILHRNVRTILQPFDILTTKKFNYLEKPFFVNSHTENLARNNPDKFTQTLINQLYKIVDLLKSAEIFQVLKKPGFHKVQHSIIYRKL